MKKSNKKLDKTEKWLLIAIWLFSIGAVGFLGLFLLSTKATDRSFISFIVQCISIVITSKELKSYRENKKNEGDDE